MKKQPKQVKGWEEGFEENNWDSEKGLMTKATLTSKGAWKGIMTVPVTKKMVKSFIQELLVKARSEAKEELVKEIKKTVKVQLETFVWDLDLGEGEIVSVILNRRKLNKFVLSYLEKLNIKK